MFSPGSHVFSEPSHQSSSGPYFLCFHRNVQDLAHCFKKIQIFRTIKFFQLFFRRCFPSIGLSNMSLEPSDRHQTPTVTIVMGCDESGKPMERSSPESQINTRLLRPRYHRFCSKQWHGNSSWVNIVLLASPIWFS